MSRFFYRPLIDTNTNTDNKMSNRDSMQGQHGTFLFGFVCLLLLCADGNATLVLGFMFKITCSDMPRFK